MYRALAPTDEEVPVRARTPQLLVVVESIVLLSSILFIGFVASKAEGDDVTWKTVFYPLWACDAIVFVLLLVSIYAPLPYLRHITEMGLGRVGSEPSTTELIPLLGEVLFKLILTCLLTVFQVLCYRIVYFGDNTTLVAASIPVFVAQGLVFLYSICVMQHTQILFMNTLAQTLTYALLVLRLEHVLKSNWTVLAPISLFNLALFFLLLRRVSVLSHKWDRLTATCFVSLLASIALFVATLTLFGLRLSSIIHLRYCILTIPYAISCLLWSVPRLVYVWKTSQRLDIETIFFSYGMSQ